MGGWGARCPRRLFCLLFLWIVGMVVFIRLTKRYQQTPEGITTTVNPHLEPCVDKTHILSEAQIIDQVQQHLPSLPIGYWNQHKNKKMFYKNESCAKYPSTFELEFNNVHWQTLHTSDGTFYLYGAYYDIRKLSEIGPSVRILGMINRIEPTVKTHCQFWFENVAEPIFVQTLEYNFIWNKTWGVDYSRGLLQPYLITCRIPEPYHQLVPATVSVVENMCDIASNNMRVIYNQPKEKKGFAVCVKGLDFLYDDLSVRLVEWIELLGILGAEKIFFYEFQVHPNISTVLNHYKELGRVDVTPLTLPGGQTNVPGLRHLYLKKQFMNKRKNELIPYNDCFYKNLYSYEYIALLDIDEVIMPMKEMSWKSLMNTVLTKSLALKNDTSASYYIQNVYFLDDLLHNHEWFEGIPRYMHMLQHVNRSKNFTAVIYDKCFHNPERALTLHNHFPLACLGSKCTSYAIEAEDAQLQHYRADCVNELKTACEEYRQNSVMDTTIWKFKDALVTHVNNTLRTLGYFGTSCVVT